MYNKKCCAVTLRMQGALVRANPRSGDVLAPSTHLAQRGGHGCVSIRERARRLPAGLPRRENFIKLHTPSSDTHTLGTEEMQCSVTLESDHNGGNVKMKTINNYKNPYKKEPNLDNIVDQLCTRLQDIKDQEGASRVGMPTCSIEETEAVRRYYAAFPALKKGRESPLPYYLPPPAWCRKSAPDSKIKMQSELTVSKDWNAKNKKITSGKERRNSYHGQKKNKKRCNSYSRSFDSKENLPEWVTHEGVWDMESQDPVKEFIRAIALDEGYGTCENTVTDEIKEITKGKIGMNENMVPDWDDSLDLDAEWVITEDLNPRVRTPMEEELYAKFEAKFDRSIEALWSKDQNTPDDEYQDLPIDFQDLLSSPSDRLFADPSAEKCSLISLTESIWSTEAADFPPPLDRGDSPSRIVDALHDRFRPLNLADVVEPEPRELEGRDLRCADYRREHDALVHGDQPQPRSQRLRRGSAAPQRGARRGPAARAPAPRSPPRRAPSRPREDLLTSARTHFRPIRRESDAEPPRYADGDTFDIAGDPDTVDFHRSRSGGLYLGSSLERYLEYRATRSIDYGRLNLTEAQRCPDLDEPGLRLRFPLRQRDAGVQTSRRASPAPRRRGLGAVRSAAAPPRRCAPAPRAPSGAAASAAPAHCRRRARAPPDELSRDWEELLSDISAAAAGARGGRGGRGRASRGPQAAAQRGPALRGHMHSPARALPAVLLAGSGCGPPAHALGFDLPIYCAATLSDSGYAFRPAIAKDVPTVAAALMPSL
ncbi:unnamed protein product [Chrysodeixis includens]|uniref:Uncharacterized protein n=1 Tax=Chrysodeixis includens TaxID=689277 RepID=A0A9N8PZC9_CHRIL|nr:unnamed protein product [Chrysodeixis includens]